MTNFSCWLRYYPHTFQEVWACYVGALPFFRNTLLGDAVFATALFGTPAVAERGFPVPREPAPSAAAA